jgi:hypothetical protein
MIALQGPACLSVGGGQCDITRHARNDPDYPDVLDAISLFTDIDACLSTLLEQQQSGFLTSLESVFPEMLKKGNIDVSAGMFVLAFFCGLRRLVLDKVYRGARSEPATKIAPGSGFAEMFVFGSQDQAYLDIRQMS